MQILSLTGERIKGLMKFQFLHLFLSEGTASVSVEG